MNKKRRKAPLVAIIDAGNSESAFASSLTSSVLLLASGLSGRGSLDRFGSCIGLIAGEAVKGDYCCHGLCEYASIKLSRQYLSNDNR